MTLCVLASVAAYQMECFRWLIFWHKIIANSFLQLRQQLYLGRLVLFFPGVKNLYFRGIIPSCICECAAQHFIGECAAQHFICVRDMAKMFARAGTRTHDLLRVRRALYQLRQSSTFWAFVSVVYKLSRNFREAQLRLCVSICPGNCYKYVFVVFAVNLLIFL